MKPVLSIIIPAYNSGKMIGNALQSILNQPYAAPRCEIIIADDCSTEPYDDVLDEFRDKLTIKQVSTDYNFAPSNTRQRGAENASGEWMCFMDHDDIWLPNRLDAIVKRLEQTDARYVISPFVEMDPFTHKISRHMGAETGWTHGKFYNKPRLWDAEKLCFKKDLKSHEDIYMTSLVNTTLMPTGEATEIVNVEAYCWIKWPKSQSKSIYHGPDSREHDFLQVFFRDYITSTGDVYLQAFKKHKIDKEQTIKNVISVIGYCYFYCQGFIFREPKTYLKQTIDHSRRFYRKCCRMLGLTKKDIYRLFGENNCELFYKTKQMASIATGPIIEPYSFGQWLNIMEAN